MQSIIGGVYYDSVARPDGRRADNKSDRNERCGQRKFEKKFSFELAKLKNGGILCLRCAENGATGCLINRPRQRRLPKKKSKIFQKPLAKLKIGDILRNCCAEKGAGC